MLRSLSLLNGRAHILPQRISLTHKQKPTLQLRQFANPPQPVPTKNLSESFIDGTSANYVEHMYNSWLRDHNSVHASWQAYFQNIDRGASPGEAFALPPTLTGAPLNVNVSQLSSSSTDSQIEELSVHLQGLIRAYQVSGHNKAKIDPLGLRKEKDVPELKLESYGISEADLDKQVVLPQGSVQLGLLSKNSTITARQVVNALEKSYCSTIGFEYMHIQDRQRCNWLRERIENRENTYVPSPDDRKNLYDRLAWATIFEHYLQKKFLEKRFGCDGGEIIIPSLKTLIDASADLGVQDMVFGMAHRGRLNVLANVLRKPYSTIFHEFKAGTRAGDGTGDVKYHLGTSYDRPTRSGKKIHLSLVANPSHLEAVNPVVEGKVSAKQYYKKDNEKMRAMSVLIHGDASFAGQGIVYETITLSGLPKYSTGGTAHVIINNQIGFTTDPEDSRPGEYCTDVAKTTGAPIFHVNGDDPDAVIWIMKLAAEWRQTFHEDFVVDIYCYRRHGHNEVDQPTFTQPLLYQRVEKQPTTLEIYAQKLILEGVLTKQEVEEINAKVWSGLEAQFAEAQNPTFHPSGSDMLSNKWEGFKSQTQIAAVKNTGVSDELFDHVAKALTTLPEGFTLHSQLERIMKQKRQMFSTGQDIDWATAEALAFGTLLLEGYHVRLSGQDVERGTFSQRHAVLHDQKDGKEYIPLNNIPGQKVHASVVNSFLSEFAALGYELGFSLETPNALVMWEAQFGDFANGAQIIIDQFISSGESKWNRQTGLVLLLPHGYEGQGPEHSSARLERFLQMCDQDLDTIPDMGPENRKQIQSTNWQIVNCTTPANYFHLLRRQIHREFRKPLVVFTPKSLLRHPLCKSPRAAFDDVGDDTRFIRLYYEVDKDLVPNDQIRRVVFCSGKVYYDLYETRQKEGVKDVAIVRIEQLAPFPFDHVMRELKRYPNADITWAQEEPKNMGAFTFCYFNFRTSLRALNDGRELGYVGRIAAASPATGSKKTHTAEQAAICDAALLIQRNKPKPSTDKDTVGDESKSTTG